MASLTVRNLDETSKSRLRQQAARHGRSMEEEVRVILSNAIEPSVSSHGLGSRIKDHFADLGGLELELPQRIYSPESPDLRE